MPVQYEYQPPNLGLRPTRELNPELVADVQAAQTASSLAELRLSGLSDRQIMALCTQVSQEINRYNNEHPSEMLSKTPQVIIDQLATGLTTLIYTMKNREPVLLFHGTAYPMFENGEERVFGTQIYEFGSEITNPAYRGGYGLGSLGAAAQRDLVLSRHSQSTTKAFGLLTLKRLFTAQIWAKANAHPIDFRRNPYLAFLTDTCEGTSERYGHESCRYRRPSSEATPVRFREELQPSAENRGLSCTLFVTDVRMAEAFDEQARRLHQQLLGTSIPRGEISVPAYAAIDQFFTYVQSRSFQI